MPGRPAAPRRRAGLAGYLFVSGYTALLLAFGVFPTGYAIYLAFTNSSGQFTGLGQFTKVVGDFRFGPAFDDIGIYLVMWLVLVVVLTVVAAVILRGRVRPGLSSVLRFLFYLPGALAGVASVLVWLFMLYPSVSPVAGLLRALGLSTFDQVIAPGNLPVILGADRVLDRRRRLDRRHVRRAEQHPRRCARGRPDRRRRPWQTAWNVQIPMIRKWIVYMVILAFATGTQLFVEPQLLGGRQPRAGQPHLVAQPAGLRVRVPVRRLQRRRRGLGLPARPRPDRRRLARDAVRPVRGGDE